MSRFAGSQRVDERRRRRLATESEATDDAPAIKASAPRQDLRTPAMGAEPVRHGWGPLAVLFSPYQARYWMLGGIAVLAALCLLYGGLEAENWSQQGGPGVKQLLAFPDAPVLSWFGQLLLLMSAETAALIWWARSRSLRDFSGSYAIWAWAAAAWLGLSLCLTTNAAAAWNATALFLWRAELTGIENLSWLFAAGLLANWLLVRLQQEMRGCPESRWTLVLAGLMYLAAAMNEIAQAWGMSQAQPLVRPALLIFAHISLLMSMSLHARHVLYETADPLPRPRRKPIRIPLPSIHIPLPRLPRWLCELWAPLPSQPHQGQRRTVQKIRDEEDTDEPAQPAKRARKPRKTTERRSDAVKSVTETSPAECEQAQEAATVAEVPSDDAAYPEPVSGPETEVNSSASENDEDNQTDVAKGRHFRVDSAHEQPSMKGLSKRERRKLQQKMRQAQRDE